MAKPCPNCKSKKNMHKAQSRENDLSRIVRNSNGRMRNYLCKRCGYAEWEMVFKPEPGGEGRASDV